MDLRRSRSATQLFALFLLAAIALLASAPDADAQFKGANGRVFYISEDSSGNKRIFSSTASGGSRKAVSPVWLDPASVAVSPNGRMVAICGGRAADQDYSIFLGPATGGRFRRLARGCSPSFSPSGKKLVYTITLPNGLRDRYEIRTIKTSGKARRTISRPTDRWLFDTKFTPNGKRIVFTATIDPNVGDYDTEIYSVRSSDGRGEQQITNDGGFDIDYTDPDVSPDGKRLLAAAYDGLANRRSIVGVPIGGGPIDILATPDSDQFDYSAPAYSPNGKRLIFERSDSAFVEYFLIFQGRLTGALPNQSLQDPPLVVPTPPASSFGAFGPVWGARPKQ